MCGWEQGLMDILINEYDGGTLPISLTWMCVNTVIIDSYRFFSYQQSGLWRSHSHTDTNTLQHRGSAISPVATGQKIDHLQWHTSDSIWSPCCSLLTFCSYLTPPWGWWMSPLLLCDPVWVGQIMNHETRQNLVKLPHSWNLQLRFIPIVLKVSMISRQLRSWSCLKNISVVMAAIYLKRCSLGWISKPVKEREELLIFFARPVSEIKRLPTFSANKTTLIL